MLALSFLSGMPAPARADTASTAAIVAGAAAIAGALLSGDRAATESVVVPVEVRDRPRAPVSGPSATRGLDALLEERVRGAVTGVESASMMGDEIRDPRRNIPRALLAAGLVVTSVYILSTLALMLILPARDIQIVDGLTKATLNATSRLGVPGLALVVAALIVVSGIGQAGAWFAAAGRLPFVAGLDRYLPPVFGRVHPRWGSPYVALLVQAVIAALFIVLAQAGTTVAGAYDVLVSTTIIAYFLPYALMFAALIAVQRMPAGHEVFRVPGGRPVAIVMALMGLAVTVGSIGLSVLPAADEQNKPLAVVKIIGLTLALVMVGVVLYLRADQAVRRG